MPCHSTLRKIVCLCKTQLQLNSSNADERLHSLFISTGNKKRTEQVHNLPTGRQAMIHRGTKAGIKNANSISSHCNIKLER